MAVTMAEVLVTVALDLVAFTGNVLDHSTTDICLRLKIYTFVEIVILSRRNNYVTTTN